MKRQITRYKCFHLDGGKSLGTMWWIELGQLLWYHSIKDRYPKFMAAIINIFKRDQFQSDHHIGVDGLIFDCYHNNKWKIDLLAFIRGEINLRMIQIWMEQMK